VYITDGIACRGIDTGIHGAGDIWDNGHLACLGLRIAPLIEMHCFLSAQPLYPLGGAVCLRTRTFQQGLSTASLSKLLHQMRARDARAVAAKSLAEGLVISLLS